MGNMFAISLNTHMAGFSISFGYLQDKLDSGRFKWNDEYHVDYNLCVAVFTGILVSNLTKFPM